MEFIANIYEKTNKGPFFRGQKVIEAENIEEAMKEAELPKELRDIAMVEVIPKHYGIETNYPLV